MSSSMNNHIDPRLRDASDSDSYSHQTPSSASKFHTPLAPSGVQFQQQYQHTPTTSPPNYYQSQTPQAISESGGANDAQDGSPSDPKRSRACEGCRNLKVKCEPDPNNNGGRCKRCEKANRHCVVNPPNRKRQKKTDSRVAELEKKINELSKVLAQQKPGSVTAPHSTDNGIEQESTPVQPHRNPYQQVTNGPYASSLFVNRPDLRGDEWLGQPKTPELERGKSSAPSIVTAGIKRKHSEFREDGHNSNSPMSFGAVTPRSSSHDPKSLPFEAGKKPPQMNEYADVIDKGLVSPELATQLFDYYVEKMAPHMPAVVFPAGTTAAEIRRTMPILFLAILSASSASNTPTLQKSLTNEVMGIYADRIIRKGDKSLELVQALHISTLWYWPPDHYEEMKFYQLIHIAAVMALDMGMGKKKAARPMGAGIWKDYPWRRTPYPDPESMESRRAWLACYFLCCNASMGLRRPLLIRWSPFMADCIDVLESSPEAAPTDRILCQWVRSQHIAEEIGTQFSMDDPSANVPISDAKVQYALKGFEKDLEKWSNQVPKDIQSPLLKMTEHIINLYMHEVAIHVDHNIEEFKPPFSEETVMRIGREPQSNPTPLSPAHRAALVECYNSLEYIFQTFLQLDVETLRCLPVSNFVRVAYAVVVLIKMYFSAASPNSEIGILISKDDLKVERYLDDLVKLFQAAAAEEKSRPSHKFLMVLTMLKTWFHRQRDGKQRAAFSNTSISSSKAPVETPSEATSEKSTIQRTGGQQQGYDPTNTPGLQLLSEVATGNSGGQTGSGNPGQFPSSSTDWQQQQPYTNYSPQTAVGMLYAPDMANIDPSLGIDLRYQTGDGFEQALGMTLGVGDFGTYFSDDSPFGNYMGPILGNSGFPTF